MEVFLPLLVRGKFVVLIGFESIPSKYCRVHIVIKEQIDLELLREGGLKSMIVKGDMNLQVSDPTQSKVKLTLGPLSSEFNTGPGGDLQFKQHPNVAKFGASGDRVVALKDPSRAFPVGQSLAVLKWRYAGKDESYVPLSSTYFVPCVVLMNR